MAINMANRAQITYDGSSAAVLSNTTNTTLVDPNKMDLTKTAVNTEVRAGGDAVYIVRLENTGTGTLSNITLVDDLGGENELAYVEGSAVFFYNGNPVTGSAVVGADGVTFTTQTEIEPDGNLIVIYAAATSGDSECKIKNTVTATARTGADAACSGNVITETACETITVISDANVSICKSADQDTVVSGDTLTYTFTLMNTGREAAENVNFTDAFPEQFNIVSVSYTENGVETPVTAADYDIVNPNTLVIPAVASSLVINVPAATAEGPGITVITVSGTVA